jgi:NitT/TauT family transport system substrate-binding protein
VRSSTRRTILWALALVLGLALVGVAYVRGGEDGGSADTAPDSPSPGVPRDPGDGCGEAATTDPEDLAVDRTLARCGPDAPAAQPLAQVAPVRVAVTERTETVAPLLVADALGELSAENLAVEIVDMPGRDAYAAMARGEVDVVVGGVDGPFFDAVHGGLGARLVLGGQVARHPSDLDTPQAGLWLHRGLIDDDDEWDNVEGQTILVPGGLAAAAVQPIDTLLAQHSLGVTNVDIVPAPSSQAVDTLHAAAVGGAWLAEPDAIEAAADEELMLATTTPGSESIDGTVFGPRLLGPDRAVGLAYARALIRTINTHLPDGYEDDALTAVAEALAVDEDVVAEGPAPLFDWELRSGTTTRLQDALTALGGVGYERPIAEDGLVDRSLAVDVIAAATDPD